jgi:hypothetical protein
MEELSILLNLAKNNRSSYQSKQIQIQKKSKQETSATILAYDGATTRYQVMDKEGNWYLARAITNSAALAIGDQVSLSLLQGGVPVIDAMPR